MGDIKNTTSIHFKETKSLKALSLEQIKELFDKSYPKPPRDVFARFSNLYFEGNPIYVAETNSKIIGLVYCIVNSKGGYLESLCVDPAFRNKSIASKLVQNLIQSNSGIIALTTRIQSFFEKFGFEKVKELPDGSIYMVKF
jgi:ribosomal protein S18 acetylase RimI-like enzyme